MSDRKTQVEREVLAALDEVWPDGHPSWFCGRQIQHLPEFEFTYVKLYARPVEPSNGLMVMCPFAVSDIEPDSVAGWLTKDSIDKIVKFRESSRIQAIPTPPSSSSTD